MESDRGLAAAGDAAALDAQLAVMEAGVYRSLVGVSGACRDIAQRAQAGGLEPQRIRAQLLASDVESRLGDAAAARATQLALHEAAAAWPLLARRAAMYLTSSCDRMGLRVEAMRWAEASLAPDGENEWPAWRAEALMVAALFTVSRTGADYTLVEQAMSAVRAACDPILAAATAANFGEVAAECGEQAYASYYADEAEATMRRHPEAASALSWESIARARLAAGELPAAEHAMKESLRVETELGCCDVNGDPWLTYAEVLLARGNPEDALAMLGHPRRVARGTLSSWTTTRELRVRAKVLAALRRWKAAYEQMVQYTAAYEHFRSVEGDRAVAETTAVVAAEEERRRAQHFERLALTDPLTGLPNRRHAERWLAEHAVEAHADMEPAQATLCLAIADLDHFKLVNDGCSHDAGDLVLKRFGALLLGAFGPHEGANSSAFVARLGGEEFLLAWGGISIGEAIELSNDLCERVRVTSFADIVGGMRITVSIGVACAARPADPSALLRAADRGLYQAKKDGRDRVVAASV